MRSAMKPGSPLMPFVAITAAIAVYSVMDTTMKFASLALGAYSATLWRSVTGFVLVLPLWLREGARRPDRALLKLHIIRGIVTAGVATSFFWGLVRLPLAEAIAISFVAPLVALVLAALLLGEKIGRPAIGASLLGLVGVIVIAFGRSGEANAHPEAGLGVIAVLVSACLYAWNLILQRQQALLAKPAEVAAFQNGVAALTLSFAAPWLLVWPVDDAWLSVGASSILQVAALMLASWAYGRAEAQALVPYEYTAFLWAALLGWVAFGEGLTLPTILGAVLIVAGCWIAAPRKHIEQTAL
jgi:S-adenosylmethionine uptake transporter